MNAATNNSLREIVGAFHQASRIVVTSHEGPDGDAVGSALGVYHLLRGLGKADVTVALADPVPAIYTWLSGSDRIVGMDDAPTDCDLAILVDAHHFDRAGAVSTVFEHARQTMVIDHHIANDPEGDLRFIDPSYAAVGEILIELFAPAGVPLTRDAAECLYVAIATDTGSFRFSNTTHRTHEVAGRLVDTGINVSDISGRVFDIMSKPKLDLMVRALSSIELFEDGRVATITVRQADYDATRATAEDLNGVINYAKHVEGVEMAFQFREAEPNVTKVSGRANPELDCAAFLRQFGGGGHAAAAGTTIECSVDEARKRVIDAVHEYLRAPR